MFSSSSTAPSRARVPAPRAKVVVIDVDVGNATLRVLENDDALCARRRPLYSPPRGAPALTPPSHRDDATQTHRYVHVRQPPTCAVYDPEKNAVCVPGRGEGRRAVGVPSGAGDAA